MAEKRTSWHRYSAPQLKELFYCLSPRSILEQNKCITRLLPCIYIFLAIPTIFFSLHILFDLWWKRKFFFSGFFFFFGEELFLAWHLHLLVFSLRFFHCCLDLDKLWKKILQKSGRQITKNTYFFWRKRLSILDIIHGGLLFFSAPTWNA